MKIAVLIIFSYLVGSVSFAQILARLHGKDLRKVGSGNLGSTNLSRACGTRCAYLCFLLDVFKGFGPTFAAKFLIISGPVTAGALGLWLAVGTAAILGHIFPLYLKFKGGKGVATSFGVVMGIWPYGAIPGIVAFIFWTVLVLAFKYISLASVLAAAVFPVLMVVFAYILDGWKLSFLWPLVAVAAVLGLLVTLLHKANIKRLLAGTENKVLQKKEK